MPQMCPTVTSTVCFTPWQKAKPPPPVRTAATTFRCCSAGVSSSGRKTAAEMVRGHIAGVGKIVAAHSNPWLEKDLDYYTANSVLLRGVLMRKWLDMNLYRGDCLQFCAFYF